MKSIILLLFSMLMISAPVFAADHAAVSNYSNVDLSGTPSKVMKAKVVAHAMKAKAKGSRVDDIILLILAIFIPPLAVYLKRGIGKDFWIDLILTLFFFVPGMLYALYVVFIQ
jgi:uncharacterized membrane protein YqaE (UPF0057 family)